MLKKRNRLTKKEFEEVFNPPAGGGEKKFSQNFLFIVLPSKTLTTDDKKALVLDKKISVAISKKVEKKAVNRVKSRRMVYKILKENFDQIPSSIQAIFLITKPILKIDQAEIKSEILRFFVEN